MAQPTHQMVKMQFALFHNVVDKEYKLSEFNPQRPAGIKEKMDALALEVEKLAQAWSVMAGRNLMADILRQFELLEPLLSASCKGAALGLKKNLMKGLDGHHPGKGKYTSALCLGWKVKTTFSNFVGDPDDRKDMEEQAQKMLQAIQSAYNLVDAADRSNGEMLKIFMAPEFYFRGARGAYGFDDVNGLNGGKGLIDILRAGIDKSLFKDWLFVFGTVIAAAKANSFRCTEKGCSGKVKFEVDPKTGKSKGVCSAGAGHAVAEFTGVATVDNVALILKGDHVHTVSKELVSDKDFNARPGTDFEVTVGKDRLYPVSDPNPNGFKDERMGGTIFTIDGITFGCEICLDHIASEKSNTAGRLDHAGNIQIQLLPSGGMSIAKFRTVKNGVIFNVDGATPHVQAVGLGSDPNIPQKIVQSFKSRPMSEQVAWTNTWEEMRTELEKSTITLTYNPTGLPSKEGVLRYGPFSIPQV